MSKLNSAKRLVKEQAETGGHVLGKWRDYTSPGANRNQDGKSTMCTGCRAAAIAENSGGIVLPGGAKLKQPCPKAKAS